MPIAISASYLYSWFTGYKLEVLMTSSLVSINSLKQHIEVQKLVDLLDYWFIIKNLKGYKQTAR